MQILQHYGHGYDFTASLMVLVQKLTSFAYNVRDASSSQVSPRQKSKAITRYPSLVEYYGYCFFLPGFFTGPFLEFRDYEDAMKDRISSPSAFFPALQKLVIGLLYLLPVVFLLPRFPMLYATTEAFRKKSILSKIIYVNIASSLYRYRFYSVWTLSEGAYTASGSSFSGYSPSGKPKFDKITNVNFIKYETSRNMKQITEMWNIGTSKWLREYVYLRVTPPGSNPSFKAVLATYTVSALWHGFYPGYYVTFLTGAFVTVVAKEWRRRVRKNVPKALEGIYLLMSWIVAQTTNNYVCAAFVSLGWNEVKAIYGATGWYVHCIVVFFVAAMQMVKLLGGKKSNKSTAGKEVAQSLESEILVEGKKEKIQ